MAVPLHSSQKANNVEERIDPDYRMPDTREMSRVIGKRDGVEDKNALESMSNGPFP
jgi:hypothetical protein